MVLLPMSSPFSRELHFCRMRRTSYTMDGFCLLCLLLILLMRSGDVETNPGPNTAESTISDMEILRLAKDISPSHYNAVGISLGIPLAQLHAILIQHLNNYTNALLDVFMKWNVMQQPPHSNKRQLLADKLREIELGGLSDSLLNGPQIPNIPGIIMVDKDALFDELSKKIPAGKYTTFCNKLDVSYNEAKSMLTRYKDNFNMALRDLLSQWDLRMMGVTRKQLEDALDGADVGGLCAIVEKHYGKASTEVATICNVSEMEFLRLAKDIPPFYYEALGLSLGFPYAELENILIEKLNNYTNAFLCIFMKWNFMQQPPHSNKRQLLADKLREIELGGLSDRLLNGPQIPNIPDDTDNNEGNSGQRTSFKQDSGSNQDDISFGGLSAPPEILARGRSAQRAYAEAAKAGTKKVYRTRLMLVGQERVGKTSLKKILTGQGFDRNEAITDGVETANTCEISIEDAKTGEKMWSILQKRKHGNEDTKHDEYSKALADVMTKKLKMISPQDQEISEPLSRGLNAKEAGLTEASLGNTNSTSQGPLASTVVDIPHPGASASVGEVSTSTAREVSDEMLNDLAERVPSNAYEKFSGKLGIGRNYARNILRKHLNDYVQATRECISIWMDKSTRSVAHLQEVLIAAELGDLIRYINKK